MSSSPSRQSFIHGPASASPSDTRGRSRMREFRQYGSVRGALRNERPYREHRLYAFDFLGNSWCKSLVRNPIPSFPVDGRHGRVKPSIAGWISPDISCAPCCRWRRRILPKRSGSRRQNAIPCAFSPFSKTRPRLPTVWCALQWTALPCRDGRRLGGSESDFAPNFCTKNSQENQTRTNGAKILVTIARCAQTAWRYVAMRHLS